ncbi:MAG: type IV pilus secretin PilQ [Rhodocyclaceae bacterium]|nr:type IV pilus secretin PilQ [Rhodocyclaceae bacterium]
MSKIVMLWRALAVMACLFLSPWAEAQGSAAPANAIQTLQATRLGGNIVVKLGLRQALQKLPAAFSVANPARIALDLPGTENGLGKNSENVNEGDLKSVNIVQVADRTRVVLNLMKMASFDTRLEGNAVVVTITPQLGQGVGTAPAASRFAESRPSEVKHGLRAVNFRRGKEGEGRIIVDLSDSDTGIDIRQQGQSLVVDFLKSSLPAKLAKTLDVTDFATPVTSIVTTTEGDSVRMVVTPKGLWEHNAYQSDNQFVLEVKQIVESANKLVQGSRPGYQGEKLSLNFQNVDVRSVLQVIADFTNFNIITSDTVGGNLTLRLKDVPWDQALDIILQAKGLDMRKNGNVIWIAPRDELAAKEKLELESKQQISDLEVTRTEGFQLNYQKADAVQKLLADKNQSILSKRGSAVVDARTNKLFVNDTPTRLEEVRKFIAEIDIATRQVLIEARIVEAQDTFARTLGAKLGFGGVYGSGSVKTTPTSSNSSSTTSTTTGGVTTVTGTSSSSAGTTTGYNAATANGLFPQYAAGSSLNATGYTSGQLSTQPTLDQLLNVNLGAGSINGMQAGSLALSLYSAGLSRFIDLELSALEADGKGKVVSSPRIMTANQVEAIIEQGTELPYSQSTSSGATAVSFRKANLSLKVKPQITPDGSIMMQLDVNKDTPDPSISNTVGIAISTKHVKTEIQVENGGTVVIGGIYTQNDSTTVTKVPFLGDVPLLGNLFKNTYRNNQKTELLVFITPKIVSNALTLQ